MKGTNDNDNRGLAVPIYEKQYKNKSKGKSLPLAKKMSKVDDDDDTGRKRYEIIHCATLLQSNFLFKTTDQEYI